MIWIVALALSLINIPVETLLSATLSRRPEFRADEFSALTTGKLFHLASALVKVVTTRSENPLLVPGFAPR